MKQGRTCVFYVPDVALIIERSHALTGVDIYIGDGATIVRPLLRKGDGVLIGHASIASQLESCRECTDRKGLSRSGPPAGSR